MRRASTVAVTGSTGWIGLGVCSWLEKQGIDVRRIGRAKNVEGLSILDLLANWDDLSWSKTACGCSAIVHCAAHVHRSSENEEERRVFRAINIEGTKKLLTAANAAGVQRFVFVSTSTLYNWSERRAMSEGDSLKPETTYAVSKLEAEKLVRDSGLDWRIARLGTVFGVGDRANFFRLARGLRHRHFILPGRGGARKSVIAVTKASELFRQACSR